VKHAITCASGTDALLMALMAYGVGPGDAIFTTPFTFIATAEVISLLGATPVFVDIDPQTFNLDPAKLELAIEALKTNGPSLHPLPVHHLSLITHHSSLVPKGIIPVDLFGLPADYDRINAIAKKHGLFVLEDAAQSFGAEYHGRKACSLADAGCTSFFPAKPLGGYGDGGAIFTDDDALAQAIRSIRVHGQGSDKYDNVRIGVNGRLDTLQAAIVLAKLGIFPAEVELRQQAAARYTELIQQQLSALGQPASVVCPQVLEGYASAWAQYSLLARDGAHRSLLQKRLNQAGIPTAIYYPKPLHLQGAFAPLGYHEKDFPVSEASSSRIFSLPMHPYLDESGQSRIAENLCKMRDC
jgi:UDP-2-acetamido-2-deoxy-ribo-hexuluronate aminotransferase